MTRDKRTTLANGRVADAALKGEVEASRYVEPSHHQCRQPIADILDQPGGTRISQLLYGDDFSVIELRNGHAFGQCGRDAYVGYVEETALGKAVTATHWVVAPATHLYPSPDVKARAPVSIFFGSAVRVLARKDAFAKIHTGHYVPTVHLAPVKSRFDDPAGVAELFLGTPYLWGGGGRWGMDCSGLIQRAMEACGIDCPRDTDMQEAALGRALDKGEPLKRGDLLFWNGHVGIMTSPRTLLHANAHHMAVALEPVIEAMRRIEATETGKVTSRRRI
ncbi:NlpC/P60 family protein [Maritimibacter sp. 55A14]|uniref:C40 family peptidase n=1 Tax=Maritimibacter sp. 55A14 TaxID=2174844 RepID=UPI001304A7BB|nr:NlpC/P60 family protein [Maritimibacter sp. 55A14]